MRVSGSRRVPEPPARMIPLRVFSVGPLEVADSLGLFMIKVRTQVDLLAAECASVSIVALDPLVGIGGPISKPRLLRLIEGAIVDEDRRGPVFLDLFERFPKEARNVMRIVDVKVVFVRWPVRHEVYRRRIRIADDIVRGFGVRLQDLEHLRDVLTFLLFQPDTDAILRDKLVFAHLAGSDRSRGLLGESMEEKNSHIEQTDADHQTAVDGCSRALLAPVRGDPAGAGNRYNKGRHKFREVRRIRSKKEILWEERQGGTRCDQER